MLTFRPERRSVERRLTPPNHVSRSQMVVRPLSVLNASSALVTHCAIELTPPDTLLIVGPLLDLVEVVGAERVVGRFVGQICHRAPYGDGRCTAPGGLQIDAATEEMPSCFKYALGK
jgi:hypothetical protein